MSTIVAVVIVVIVLWIMFSALIATIISMNSSLISKEKEIAWLQEVLKECEEKEDGESNGRGQEKALSNR